MTGALDGVRVIDCSEGVAGPMAAMYLADFGADVVKVEPPGGDRARQQPGFVVWNRNKRGIVADLHDLDGRQRLRDLLRGADVCLFSRSLGELEALGFDPISVQGLNPAAVYLHLPAFTTSGPGSAAPESAELLCAETGVSASQYSFADVPIDPVIPHVLYGQAIWAAAAVTAALVERHRSGFGQTVTVGGLHGMLVTSTSLVTRQPGAKAVHPPGGAGGPLPFYRLYQCQDGAWLFLAGLTAAFFTAAFSALGVLEDLLADPRLGGELIAAALPDNSPWVIEIVARAFRSKPRDEWLRLIREAGCPCGPVLDRDTWFDHEQVAAIGLRVTLDDPEYGVVAMPGLSLHLTRSPATIRHAAPTLGQHDQEVAATAATPAPTGQPPAAHGPLASVRVLDLGAIVAGPLAASLLADLGADVIKVEPLGGDNLRAFAPTYVGYNLGQRSLCMDLRSAAGRDAFYRLVRDADVVIDNYRPGVLQRLRLDFESLAAINPRIISVSVTGYGESGPLGAEPGFDPLLQAASGMMQAQGGNSQPVFFTLPVNDVATAATAALGAVLALYHRESRGEGQRVWTSLAGQSVMMQCAELVRYAGKPPARLGGRDFPGPSALDRLYPTANGWLRLQATAGRHVDGLRRAGFLPQVSAGSDEPGMATALTQAFATLDRDMAVERLRLAGVPAAPVRKLPELPLDPQFLAAKALQLLELADGTQVWTAGRYAAFSRTEAAGIKGVAGPGEHSVAVLKERGFSSGEIERLLVAGTIAAGPPFRLVGPGA